MKTRDRCGGTCCNPSYSRAEDRQMHSELNWAKGKPYLKQTKAKQKKKQTKKDRSFMKMKLLVILQTNKYETS
jgi:hypothetical protein